MVPAATESEYLPTETNASEMNKSATPTSIGSNKSQTRVHVLKLGVFYSTLYKLKIKKSAEACDNLSQFLQPNSYQEGTDLIFVKHLLKVVD